MGFAGALGMARDGAGVGGSVTVNVVSNRIESYILNSQVRYDGTDSSGHDINVSALDKTTLIAITGAAGVGKKAGVGIAISYNEIGNAVLAGIQGSVVNNKGGSVSVTAEDNSALGGGAVGVGVGMGEAMFAGAGSIQVNRVHSAVAAYVLPRYVNNVAVAGSSAITANALTVKATENNTLVAVTGGVAVTLGGSVAVGASVSVNEFSSRTSALIENSAIDVQGKLDLSAHSSPLMVSVGAAGALSKVRAGRRGQRQHDAGATEARISNSTVKAGQATGFGAGRARQCLGCVGAVRHHGGGRGGDRGRGRGPGRGRQHHGRQYRLRPQPAELRQQAAGRFGRAGADRRGGRQRLAGDPSQGDRRHRDQRRARHSRRHQRTPAWWIRWRRAATPS